MKEMSKSEIEIYKTIGLNLINESDFERVLLKIESNLGNIDSQIRESCLDLLWELIESKILSAEVLLEMGNRLIKNIEYIDDEKGTDSIFLRTFSALIIALIITQDEILYISGENSFLPYDEYKIWYEKSILYVKTENDFRGYISGKGWAHAISHSADLLRDLTFHRYSTEVNHIEILNIINSQLKKYDNLSFINNDDNRLTRIIIVMLYRGLLNISDYENWLNNLSSVFDEKHWIDISENQELSTIWFNVITFLRAVYFTLEFGMKNIKNIPLFEGKPKLNDELKDITLLVIKKMDSGLNYL